MRGSRHLSGQHILSHLPRGGKVGIGIAAAMSNEDQQGNNLNHKSTQDKTSMQGKCIEVVSKLSKDEVSKYDADQSQWPDLLLASHQPSWSVRKWQRDTMAIPTSFVIIMYYICLHVGLHVAAQHSGHQTSGGLAVLQHCLSILGYHYKCDNAGKIVPLYSV